jgi:hypothetical protein
MFLCAQLSPDDVIHVWTDIGVVFRLEVNGQAKVEHTECLDSTSYVAWAAGIGSFPFGPKDPLWLFLFFCLEVSSNAVEVASRLVPLTRCYTCIVEVAISFFAYNCGSA